MACARRARTADVVCSLTRRLSTRALTSLLGREVVRGDRTLGLLDDVVIGPNGVLDELIVLSDGAEQRVAFDAQIRLAPGSRTAA